MARVVTKNSTYRFYLTATKDQVTWDLTGATVTLILADPDGNLTTKSATIVSAAAGTAYADLTTSDLDEAGRWYACFRVVQGSIDIRSLPEELKVVSSPV